MSTLPNSISQLKRLFRLTFVLVALSMMFSPLTACSVANIRQNERQNDDGVRPPSSAYVQEIGYEAMLTVVANSALPVFVEEYDPKHCDADCAAQHQVVNTLAAAYKDKVRFVRVTTSEEEFQSGVAYPVYYMVKPPLQVYDTESGAKSEAQLKTFIDEAYAAMYPPPEVKEPAAARSGARKPVMPKPL